jgi:hypothetical protein
LSSFWLILKQQWTIEEISIFSNSSHLEWRAGLSETILKGTHPETTPARFGLIWFSGFIGEDLYVIFCQNMPNLHNRYISAERNICVVPVSRQIIPWISTWSLHVKWRDFIFLYIVVHLNNASTTPENGKENIKIETGNIIWNIITLEGFGKNKRK